LTVLRETRTELPVLYHHEKDNHDLATFYSRYSQLTYGGIHTFTKYSDEVRNSVDIYSIEFCLSLWKKNEVGQGKYKGLKT